MLYQPCGEHNVKKHMHYGCHLLANWPSTLQIGTLKTFRTKKKSIILCYPVYLHYGQLLAY